jgi:hypothetical protein
MSTDFSIRPVGTPAPSPIIQPLSQAANNAVPTELPANQSVTAPDASTFVRNDSLSLTDDALISHQAFFDREAASMVYQSVNSNTDQVVEQYPDEAVLRRRAYFHTLEQAKSSPPRRIPTDVRA